MNTLAQIFDWLLATSLRASLLTLATLLIQAVLRRHLDARMRYALWLPVLIVMLMPVFPQSRWSLEYFFQSPPPPMPAPMIPASMGPEIEPAQVTATQAHQPVDWRHILHLAWISVSAGIFVFGCVSFMLTLRRFQKARQPVGKELLVIIAQIAREMHLRHVPQVVVSSTVSSPAVTGVLRPTLLLPADFDHEFTPGEAQLVLKHELMHLKRGDLPLNALMCVLMALHWFNPLLWIAFFRIRTDREAACDAQVLHDAPHGRRIEYGHALLKVETAFCPRGLSLGFVGIFQRGPALRSRIQSIISQPHPHPIMKATLATCIVVLTFFGITRAENPAEPSAHIKTKLDKLIIPQVQLRDATVELCVDILHSKSRELDTTTTDPAQRGVSILLLPSVPPVKASITLDLKNVPLGEALRYVAELANLSMSITPDAVVISPAASAEEAKKQPTAPSVSKSSFFGQMTVTAQETNYDARTGIHTARGDASCLANGLSVRAAELIFDTKAQQLKIIGPFTIIERGRQKYSSTYGSPTSESSANLDLTTGKLTTAGMHKTEIIMPPAGKIILPEVNFRKASLAECLDIIRTKSREADPEKKGAEIILNKGADTKSADKEALITMSLTNIPVFEALRYCADLSGHKLKCDGTSFMLTPSASVK